MSTLIITGGRDYAFTDKDRVILDALHNTHQFSLVIEGGCRRKDYRGDMLPTADYCGYLWARSHGIQTATMDANWDKHGKAAGPIRNTAMADIGVKLGAIVVGFPGGRGTEDMCGKAEGRMMRVIRQ